MSESRIRVGVRFRTTKQNRAGFAQVTAIAVLCGILCATSSVRADEGGCAVTALEVVTQPSAPNNVEFGRVVDIDGDVAIVGDYGDDAPSQSGAATILRFDGSNWAVEQKLEPSNPITNGFFGRAVGISGDWAIVGEDGRGSNAGRVYFFRFDGTQWIEEQFFGGSSSSNLGKAVAIDGDVAIGGAWFANGISGEAIVYRFDGLVWAEEEILTSGLPGGSIETFGIDVDIRGDTAVVGAALHDDPFENCGAAFAFRFDGSTWERQQLPVTPVDSQQFGRYVAIDESGDRVLIAAPIAEDLTGRVYLYHYEGTGWTEVQQLVASDRQPGDLFGSGIAIEDDVVLVGAANRDGARGVTFVFRDLGLEWVETDMLIPDSRNEIQVFGSSVDVSGTTAVIGAPGDDIGANNGGAVHLYTVPDCATRCKGGSVNGATGEATDVLYVNGSSGDAVGRCMSVDAGDRVWAVLLSAPEGGPGKFVVHANLADPTDATASVLPAAIGTVCFPFLLNDGATPAAVWNNIGKESKVGASEYLDGSPMPNPARTPCVFLELSAGDLTNLPAGTVMTMQAILLDPASPSAKAASATNAVVVHVE